MTHDELVAELTLVLFYLNSWTEKVRGMPAGFETRRAWKGADWEAIDALRDTGLVQCSNKAKSLTISDEGAACAEQPLDACGLNGLLYEDVRSTFVAQKISDELT